MRPEQTRTYDRAGSVVFLKTDEPFGGLSNMAGGFPLWVNGIRILTSEALYQACRFPHRSEVQALIIEQKSPMTAKMKSKPYRQDSRPDWDQVRVKIMRWCLRVKLAQNWRAFSKLLLDTGERSIVEESRKDAFWGAKPTDDGTLVGMNVLGRLLMELREAVRGEGREALMSVQPLTIPDFMLGGRPIEIVTSQAIERNLERGKAAMTSDGGGGYGRASRQPSLFDESAVREAPHQAYSAVRAQSVQLAELKPYAEYKESGLPWLGRVPGHWEMRPAFGAFVPNHERNHGMKERTVLSLSYGRIVIKPADKLHGLVPESFETYQIVNPGDIVLRTTDLQNDHSSLRVGMVRDRGIITSAYLALRTAQGLTPEFGFQFLNVWDASKAIYGYGSGLRQNLDFSHFKRMPVAVPPPEEQAAIVRFLDWANGRLERAIRAKRKVIALLGEQKQAIIHRAVTRGLDPSVPLKPSGIPWLGDIPQHWELWRISRFARVGNGSTPSRANPMYWHGGNYPWLNSSQVNRGHINSADQFVTQLALRECHLPKVHAGSILVAITGQGKTRGMAALLGIEATINQHIAFITPRMPVASPAFIHLALTAAYPQLRATSDDSGSTKGAITCEDLKRFKLPMPPRAEQDSIVRRIHTETQDLNAAASRLNREIELLREYRTRLVADVVTGKLDVREAAARLPDDQDFDPVADTQAEIEDDDMVIDAMAG